MTELTRPFRRLLGRSDADAAPRRPPSPAAPVADASSGRRRRVDRRRHPRVRPAARLPPVRARAGRRRAARARLAGRHGAPRGRRRAGRAARLAGRADRHAEPRAAPVGAGLLDRRPPAADDARRPGRARPSASRSSSASRPHEAAERERLDQELRVATLIQQQFLPRELPQPARSGRSPRTTARRGRSAATSTTSSRCRDGRIGIAVGDVTDKGVPAALVMARTHSHPARRGQPQRLARRDPGAGQRPARARRCRPGCS